MLVYFIKAGDAVKIGFANNIKNRLHSIQVGNQYKLELLHMISTSDENARAIETKIHEIFHRAHLNGEWYQISQTMVEFIENIKKNGWESHLEWIEKRYKKEYNKIIESFNVLIDKDINIGDTISLELLLKELDISRTKIKDYLKIKILNIDRGRSVTGDVRKWIDNREDPFEIKDIYYELGIENKNMKKNISVILGRLISAGRIKRERVSANKSIFKKP